ncbi:ChaN family lipoprotein [Cereibacter changlensis]|uniref:ChaN family lipoprotein n=1 Tax=Cereibacter changlensis TaxID=402884 RepID=UPI004033D549
MKWLSFLGALAFASPAAAERISASDLRRLPPADVVILGEVHDNPLHHQHQALAVAALRPSALVFEMLTPERAEAVTPALRGDAEALSRALDWDESGWPAFSMYHPILLAAPAAQVFGGDVPRDRLRLSVSDGAGAAFGDGAARYGLAAALPDAEQAARQEEQRVAHCDALPAELLPGMVEAQRLRDAALARAVIQAHAATGGPVAVITGSGHARRDRGVPAALALAAPELSVLSVGQLEEDPAASAPFDLWVVTSPAQRDDPCAALRGR